MARKRMIDPEFFGDEDVVELPFEARLLFIGSWCIADDNGVLADKPKQMKMAVFPGDAVDCQPLRDAIVHRSLWVAFESQGEHYLWITGFPKHQTIDRPTFRHPIPPLEVLTKHECFVQNGQVLSLRAGNGRRRISDGSAISRQPFGAKERKEEKEQNEGIASGNGSADMTKKMASSLVGYELIAKQNPKAMAGKLQSFGFPADIVDSVLDRSKKADNPLGFIIAGLTAWKHQQKENGNERECSDIGSVSTV